MQALLTATLQEKISHQLGQGVRPLRISPGELLSGQVASGVAHPPTDEDMVRAAQAAQEALTVRATVRFMHSVFVVQPC